MKSSKLVITGCDSSTEWMLPWFVDNYRRHNNTELMIFDFGMTTSLYPELRKSHRTSDKGWYKKPSAMQKALAFADKVVWLDTDCEVRGDISEIFDLIVPNKLLMGEDTPWTTRSGQQWHNTGVVGFQGPSCPVLDEWSRLVAFSEQAPTSGDQQILHAYLQGGMNRLMYVKTLPKKYNCLRLDREDGTAVPDPVVMHWTGPKGKLMIKELMNV